MTSASAKSGSINLDVDYIRQQFPTLTEPLGSRTAFFENAGGSYVTGPVLEKLLHFYRCNKVQPYGASEIQSAAGEQMDSGRSAMAQLLGIDPTTLTLGASTTQNINTLAIACAPLVDKTRDVIVTEQDHEANIGAWQRLCERSGATLRVWPVNSQTGELDINEFGNMLGKQTAIVCVTHSSNIVGTVNPVEEVIKLSRANDSRVIVDGVSYAPHRWPDIPTLQPDAYCFSSYKTYATHLGVMYVSTEFGTTLDPQCHYFNSGHGGKKFDSSGPDHASIAALAGLGDYFSDIYQHHFGNDTSELYHQAQHMAELMHSHEKNLCGELLEAVSSLPLRIIGKNTMHGREANIALASDRFSSAQLSTALAKQDIAAGNGDFYARRLIEKVGIADADDGVLRISFAHYNTHSEVQRVIDALNSIH